MGRSAWDTIYREKLDYATSNLNEPDHLFVKLLSRCSLPVGRSLEVGCGQGRHFPTLLELRLECAGIDNSEEAIRICRERFSSTVRLEKANMFSYQYPLEQFGLIFSVSTIHHGPKPCVNELISFLAWALVPGGNLIITLPQLERQRFHQSKEEVEVCEGTYAPIEGPEAGVPHSYYEEDEIRNLLKDYFGPVTIKRSSDLALFYIHAVRL